MEIPYTWTGERRSGVLLHITSLPSPFGVGDLGPEAHRFSRCLARSCQKAWQVLPLQPVSRGAGYSPYHCLSAFGGNPLLISPEILAADGLVDPAHIPRDAVPEGVADFPRAWKIKEKLLHEAFSSFFSDPAPSYQTFCRDQGGWLPDYAIFMALSRRYGELPWTMWEPSLRDRNPKSLHAVSHDLSEDIRFHMFVQYVFDSQWERLKTTCNRQGISIIGDIPLYVAGDSCDVWCNRHLFDLFPDGTPRTVSGVPPDYFSATGQRWGTPVYLWDRLAQTGYSWWVSRLFHLSRFCNEIRIDHFRGLEAFFAIPAREETAEKGVWVTGPGNSFLEVLERAHIPARLIAEDLGIITPGVRVLMKRFGLPGMKVLQFAFGAGMATNPHVPFLHSPEDMIYTGTHDNNTARGWFEDESDDEERRNLCAYVGKDVTARTVHREFVRLAMLSVGATCMIPFQDLAGLDGKARMNLPGTPAGNWMYRMKQGDFSKNLMNWLSDLTLLSGRAVPSKDLLG